MKRRLQPAEVRHSCYEMSAAAAESEALLLTAAGDGVGPAILLTVAGGKRQYLFNVPEGAPALAAARRGKSERRHLYSPTVRTRHPGCSRLALEHKVRPGGRLAAVFATGSHPQELVRPPAVARPCFSRSRETQRGRPGLSTVPAHPLVICALWTRNAVRYTVI